MSLVSPLQVQYNINGWLDKNKDPIQECVIQLMQESKEHLVSTFFKEAEEGLLPRRHPILFNFYRATRMHSADCVVARCPSVRLFVCHTPVLSRRLNISSNSFHHWVATPF